MPFELSKLTVGALFNRPYIVDARHHECWLFDDFNMCQYANSDKWPGWWTVINGGGTDDPDNTSRTDAMGIINLLANNGNDEMTNRAKFLHVSQASDIARAEFRCAVSAVRPNQSIVCQMYDDANNFYEFYMGNAGNWFCRGTEGGIQRFNQDSGVLPVQIGAGWQTLQIVAEFSQVRFYIDGALVHTHNAALGLLANNHFYIRVYVNHPVVSNCSIYFDWILGKQTLHTQRPTYEFVV